MPPKEKCIHDLMAWCCCVGLLVKIRDHDYYYNNIAFHSVEKNDSWKEKKSNKRLEEKSLSDPSRKLPMSRGTRRIMSSDDKTEMAKSIEEADEVKIGRSLATTACSSLSPFTHYYLTSTRLNKQPMPVLYFLIAYDFEILKKDIKYHLQNIIFILLFFDLLKHYNIISQF